MEDYKNLVLSRKPKKFMTEEDWLTLNWLETEWAEFWCEEVLGISLY